MATPNEASDLQIRIQQARAWLQEQDNGTMTDLSNPQTTLSSSIQMPSSRSHGGLNLNQFIRSYLDHCLLSTKCVILSAITRLRALENKPPPSTSWFQKWWKTQPLHEIKTRPIAYVRITAPDKVEVHEWFKKYREVLQKYKLSRRDIRNFDETGF
jgi:hypothetical protein